MSPITSYENDETALWVCEILHCDFDKCSITDPTQCEKHIALHQMCDLICPTEEE